MESTKSTTPPRFDLDRELGRGATGRVLHGVLLEDFGDRKAGAEVAVKYLHHELEADPAAAQAFEREAGAALAVDHPGLVRALYCGRDEAGLFLAMDYVPGRTLRDALIESGPLPEPTVRSIAAQVAAGLSALHETGYVHGDVKPDNVRLDSGGRAVLVDLGFADSASTGSAADDRAFGTPLYLAPERIRGTRNRSSSDVFALGVVLYELATDRHPFVELGGKDGTEPAFVMDRLVDASFVAPSSIDPSLSPFLDAVLEEMLASSAKLRPSAAELHERFDQGEGSSWWRARIEYGASARRAAGRELTPFVGRERGIETLRALARTALSGGGPPTIVRIAGIAGIGKTRLAHEFAFMERTSHEPPIFLYGRCHLMRDDRPCQPILRMLQRYLGLPKNVAPSGREQEHLETLVPPRSVTTLLRALDPEFDGTTPTSVPVALADWLRAVTARLPSLVFLDDLQHADLGTLKVLSLALEPEHPARALWILALNESATARHGDQLAFLFDRVDARSIELEPLSKSDVAHLVADLFEHAAPRLRLADALWRRSHGHPGLASEILRGLIQRGEARPSSDEEGMYALTVAPEKLPLPDSEKRAITESFRALPDDDRAWLGRLSVVRSRIETDFLLHAFPPAERTEVDDVLARLVRAGWIVSAGARYRFARPTARDAVYRSLSDSNRDRLHTTAARALKPRAGEPTPIADAVQRAFHLHAAGCHAEYLRLSRPLLDRLLRRGLPQRVLTLAKWGLEAIDALGDGAVGIRRTIELLEAAADAADRLGQRGEERALLDRLSRIEISTEDREALGRAYLLHGRYAASTGSYGLARGWLANAVKILEESQVVDLASDALSRLAAVQSHVGELDEAKRLAQRALEATPDPVRRAHAHLALAGVDVLSDRLEPAIRNADKALRLLRNARDRDVGEATANANLLRTRIHRSSGRPARALGAARRALEGARRSGERRLEAECGARVGGLLLDFDRSEEAEAMLREAWLSALEIEDRRGQALAALFLGILLAEDDRKDAARWLSRATELSGEVGLNRLQALALAVEARLDMLEGRIERANAAMTRAIFLVERFGSELLDRVVIEGTQALLCERLGETERSKELRRGLDRRLRREVSRLGSDVLRRRRRLALRRLLDAVFSPDGPLYPRLPLPGATVGE